MTSDHKAQSDQAASSSDTSKARKGVDLINQQLQGTGETNSDTLQLADQVAGPSDTSKARKGVDQINLLLQGTGETNSDTLQLSDQATGPGDTNQACEGVEQTNQRLKNDGNDTALNDAGAGLPDSQQSTKDLGVAKADLNAKSSESRNEIIQVDDDAEIRFDELKPNAVYEKKGYRFYTDEQGRPAKIGGFLQDEPGSRSSQQTEVGHLGLKDDEGGHLIATRFNGPTDGFNLVPQHMNLNRGAWKTMENEWDKILDQGGAVEVAISPVYLDDTRRPMGFDVMYRVIDQSGDNYYTKTLYNQSSKEE